MNRNKVVYNGNTLIDLTSDTVTPETLIEGVTAHDAAGNIIVGTLSISDIVHHDVKKLANVRSCVGTHINK